MEPSVFLSFHPNGMTFRSKNSLGEVTDEWTVFSVGGGALAEEGKPFDETPELYEMNSMTQILSWCERTGRSYWEYVQECEDHDIWDYLAEVWSTMREAIERGLDQEGVLPGPLNLRRKASSYYIKAKGYKDSLKSRGLVFAYALAVSEENASGGRIVTAPTCGSCGVVPAVLYHLQKHFKSVGDRRFGGEYREAKCFYIGSRSGVSRRSGSGMCYGFGGSQPVVRR